MDIVRNSDGTLLVPVVPERKHAADDAGSDAPPGAEVDTAPVEADPATRLLHPGEGGTTKRWPSGTCSRIPIASRSCRPPVVDRRR